MDKQLQNIFEAYNNTTVPKFIDIPVKKTADKKEKDQYLLMEGACKSFGVDTNVPKLIEKYPGLDWNHKFSDGTYPLYWVSSYPKLIIKLINELHVKPEQANDKITPLHEFCRKWHNPKNDSELSVKALAALVKAGANINKRMDDELKRSPLELLCARSVKDPSAAAMINWLIDNTNVKITPMAFDSIVRNGYDLELIKKFVEKGAEVTDKLIKNAWYAKPEIQKFLKEHLNK